MGITTWGTGRPQAPAGGPSGAGAAAAFAAAADAAVQDLVGTPGVEVVAVSRMTDLTWTGVAARSDTRPAPVGRQVPVALSACHHLLVDRRPVLERDLRRHASPAVRELAARSGVSAYAGAALLDRHGRRLGSVCGYSAERFDRDDGGRLLDRLARAADDLGPRLGAALAAAADEQRAAYARALVSADAVTGLPDRRGWGALLQDEGARTRQLGEGMSVVLLDVGLVRTVRGLRRAAQVLREALGDVGVSRVGRRQFGVVGGVTGLDPAAVAATARGALRGAGYLATSGWATSDHVEGAVGTWWRAEDALLRARADGAAP